MPKVGFWSEPSQPGLPMPHVSAEPQPGHEEFLFQLAWIEARLWDLHYEFMKLYEIWGRERELMRKQGLPLAREWEDPTKPSWEIIEKLIRGYRGSSRCRLCDCRNGSYEYELDGWVWPEGYMHYLKDHNVTPNEAFRQWVINKEFGIPTGK